MRRTIRETWYVEQADGLASNRRQTLTRCG